MLENTFIHLPNFGPNREKKLWNSGIKTWDDFLEEFSSSPYHSHLCSLVARSKNALKSRNASHFGYAMPKNETWRCVPDFPKAAYLDIETTGFLAPHNYVTVIGVYDGKKTRSYVQGDNLDEFADDIAKFDTVVTFNGSLFDLPFIRCEIPEAPLPSIHIDLRFLLSSLEVRGGLKKIEQKFGLERDDDLKGLTGYDAVLLWRKYKKHKDKTALEKLVRYNAADVSNLKILIEWAYKEKRKRIGID